MKNKMNIVIYGLGIIGASLAAALKDAGHTVLGKNRSRGAIEYALAHQMIDKEAASYEGADAVFVALPPDATMKELDEGDFPEGCIVCDICGVKEAVEKVVFSKPRKYRYVGTHPMAGKETSGILSASRDLYRGKNLVITRAAKTDEEALETVKRLACDAGFGYIVECTAREHDEKIALTSQLAHIVSNAYGKSPLALSVKGFTGGSFQDMTRIAGVEEGVWSELYLLNKENLSARIAQLIENLSEIKSALDGGDAEELKGVLKAGKDRFFEYKERSSEGGIKLTMLK